MAKLEERMAIRAHGLVDGHGLVSIHGLVRMAKLEDDLDERIHLGSRGTQKESDGQEGGGQEPQPFLKPQFLLANGRYDVTRASHERLTVFLLA